jgi:AcrR family transcriptional regulator
MGLRSPALYRYFVSLGDLYDWLFALGQEQNAQAVHKAITDTARGVDRIRIGTRATVRWCVTHPALAQLLHWRVVPGFEPTEQTFAAGVGGVMDELRAEFAEAVRRRQLDPRADSEEAVLLLTVQMSGLITQQLANEPGATFEEGVFTRLTDEAI